MYVCVYKTYLRQQRSLEGDLVVVSWESWQCTGNGVGLKTSSSSPIEGKGMACLISLKLLKERGPPLQDTYMYRYVHAHIEKHRHICNTLCEKCVNLSRQSSDHIQANFTV